MGGYYDEVEIEDMAWDDVAKVFHYPCPCGDRFEISRGQLANYEEIATCPSCSLIIRVIFDPLDFEDDAEEEEEDEGEASENEEKEEDEEEFHDAKDVVSTPASSTEDLATATSTLNLAGKTSVLVDPIARAKEKDILFGAESKDNYIDGISTGGEIAVGGA